MLLTERRPRCVRCEYPRVIAPPSKRNSLHSCWQAASVRVTPLLPLGLSLAQGRTLGSIRVTLAWLARWAG